MIAFIKQQPQKPTHLPSQYHWRTYFGIRILSKRTQRRAMRKADTLPTTVLEWERHRQLAFITPTRMIQRSLTSCPSSFKLADDQSESEFVHAGWLAIACNGRREFKWRFCVLDGVHFSYFRDDSPVVSPATRTRRSLSLAALGHHELVSAERMHCLNRGILLIDANQDRLWVHADASTATYERWFSLLESAIRYQRQRLDGSLFDRQAVSSHPKDDLEASFTGWLFIRRRLLGKWLHGPEQRMYCVLSRDNLSGFAINCEGRYADFSARICQVEPLLVRNKWIQLKLNDGRWMELAGRNPETTRQWMGRLCLLFVA